MADLLRLIRRVLWFLIGFSVPVVMALYMERADAAACTSLTLDRQLWSDNCDTMKETLCDTSPGYYGCENGSCTYNGESYPSCNLTNIPGGYFQQLNGFWGTCPADGTEGPNIEFTGAPSEAPPNNHCNAGCMVDSNGCTSVGLPDGTIDQLCQTAYTGERCIPGTSNPAAEDSEPNPEVCESGAEINGNCVSISDLDGDSSTSPSEPGICMGVTCIPVPPNPNHNVGCEYGTEGAICVGSPNQPDSAPSPSSPPYPPNQQPQFSTNANSSQGPTPVDVYGPPQSNDAGDPDANGECSGGAVNVNDRCICPNGLWNGNACTDDGEENGEEDGVCNEELQNDPDCDDGPRTAEHGTCGATPPQCSGDEIDCSILHQTWQTRCALTGSEGPPGLDLDADPLHEYGGAEALFSSDDIGPGSLDESGFLGGGGCPTMPPITVLGKTITWPAVWCELAWLGTLLVGLAYLIAARIVYGD